MSGMTIEQLAQDISQRFAALGEQVSEAKIKAMIDGQLVGLMNDAEFVRKMRFGGNADARLTGTKFHRWGLNMGDVEFLFDIMHAERERGKRGPSEELDKLFKAYSDAAYIPQEQIRAMDRQAIDNLFPRVHKGNHAEYEAAIRAMDTAESGYGSQLVGVQYVADLWEAARNASRVGNLIGSFEMTAPTAYLPVEVDFPAMIYVAENTDPDTVYQTPYPTSKTGSQRVTVTAKKFVIRQMWSGEMEEDSILPFVPFLRRQTQLSLAYYQDALALNGDTTGTNGINGRDSVLATGTYATALDGIRHTGLVDNTGNSASAGGAPISLELFNAIYPRLIDGTYMHDWGNPNDPADLVHIVDPYTANAMNLIDEFRTMQNAGNQATIFTGQVAKVFNHPVISSIAVKKSYSDGYVDADTAGNNLYGQVVTFNRNAYKWGWRRRIQVETSRKPETDQTSIISSLRLGLGRFTPTGAASGMKHSDVLYYIGL